MGGAQTKCGVCAADRCCTGQSGPETEDVAPVMMGIPGLAGGSSTEQFGVSAASVGRVDAVPSAVAGAAAKDLSEFGLNTASVEQTVRYNDGSAYTGQLADGMREGHGTWTSASGSYEGQWRRSSLDGYGKQQWTDGRTYEGQFREGKFDGRGVMTWITAQGTMVYDGQYKNDVKHGQGRFVWPDGRIYDGAWQHGKRSGMGTYTNLKGEAKAGAWEEDKFVKWNNDLS